MASELDSNVNVRSAALATDAPSTGARRGQRRRRAPWMVLWVLIVLALAAAGWFGWRAWSGAGAGVEKPVTAAVLRGDIEETVTATGTLQPRDFVDVGTQVSGQLKKLHIEIGSSVKQGQLLAEIEIG